jgi:hypothetical protein
MVNHFFLLLEGITVWRSYWILTLVGWSSIALKRMCSYSGCFYYRPLNNDLSTVAELLLSGAHRTPLTEARYVYTVIRGH